MFENTTRFNSYLTIKPPTKNLTLTCLPNSEDNLKAMFALESRPVVTMFLLTSNIFRETSKGFFATTFDGKSLENSMIHAGAIIYV